MLEQKTFQEKRRTIFIQIKRRKEEELLNYKKNILRKTKKLKRGSKIFTWNKRY